MNQESMPHPDVFTVDERETLVAAANKMQLNAIGSLAVLRDGGFAGIITERDLARAVSDGVDSTRSPVTNYMTDDPIVASPDDGVREVAARMVVLGIRHVPLMANGEVVGMVSIRDLLERTALSDEGDLSWGGTIRELT